MVVHNNGVGIGDSRDNLRSGPEDSAVRGAHLDHRGGNLGGGNSSNRGVDRDSWGAGLTVISHDSVESIDSVSGVGDASDAAVGVSHGVRSGHHITISALFTGLAVSGLDVGHGVAKVVGGVDVNDLSLDGSGHGTDGGSGDTDRDGGGDSVGDGVGSEGSGG